jgi:large subunit ribosomal protein L25
MDSPTLTTQPRDGRGKRATRKLRTQGLIPAVVYGHKEAVLALALPQAEFESALRHNVRVVDLQAGGKTETAVIQEVQYDHLGKEVLHVDFKRVSKDERIVVAVKVELKGTAPGATTGIVEQPLHELQIECLAIRIPESIRVNISTLHLGDAVHVKDVPLPEGVTVMNDPEAIVVHVVAPAGEPEPVAAAAAEPGETAAEPEIVGRRVKAEEGEE